MAQNSEHVRNIGLDILFTVLSCGLFNIYLQHRQMLALNSILKQDKYGFWGWLGFCLITCGLYHIYHEYRMSDDLRKAMGIDSETDAIVALLLSLFGLFIVTDAIQQSKINEYFGAHHL